MTVSIHELAIKYRPYANKPYKVAKLKVVHNVTLSEGCNKLENVPCIGRVKIGHRQFEIRLCTDISYKLNVNYGTITVSPHAKEVKVCQWIKPSRKPSPMTDNLRRVLTRFTNKQINIIGYNLTATRVNYLHGGAL